jgi:pyridoxal biosynthesis lyase PdxS
VIRDQVIFCGVALDRWAPPSYHTINVLIHSHHHTPNKQTKQAPLELVQEVARTGRLPVVNFAAGGVATPADAALMMQLGMDGVFVGSGIFKSTDPVKRARAIVQAVTHFKNPKVGRCAFPSTL